MIVSKNYTNYYKSLSISQLNRTIQCWSSLNPYIKVQPHSIATSVSGKVLEVWHEPIPSANPGSFLSLHAKDNHHITKVKFSSEVDIMLTHINSFEDKALVISSIYCESVICQYRWHYIDFSLCRLTSGSFRTISDDIKIAFINSSTFVIHRGTVAKKYYIYSNSVTVSYKDCKIPKFFSIYYKLSGVGYATYNIGKEWFVATIDNYCIVNNKLLPSYYLFYKVRAGGTVDLPFLYGVTKEKQVLRIFPDPLLDHHHDISLKEPYKQVDVLYDHATNITTIVQINDKKSTTVFYKVEGKNIEQITKIVQEGWHQTPIHHVSVRSPITTCNSLWKDVTPSGTIISGRITKVLQYMLWARVGNFISPGMFPETYFVSKQDKSIAVSFVHPYLNVHPIDCPDDARSQFETTVSLLAMPVIIGNLACYPSVHNKKKINIFYHDFQKPAQYALDGDTQEQIRTLHTWEEITEAWISFKPSTIDKAICLNNMPFLSRILNLKREEYWKIIDDVACASLKNSWLDNHFWNGEQEITEDVEIVSQRMQSIMNDRLDILDTLCLLGDTNERT